MPRLKTLRFAPFTVVALGLAATALATRAAESPRRPNIVLILADDLGFSDLGCYGGEIDTPNLDRLAAEGLRYTRFYNAGRCCPTRASLLTGLYAHQTGMGLMEEDLALPGYRGALNRNCVTIGEVLQRAGYRTLVSGKWNVGYRRPQWPVDRGFDRAFGLLRGASDYFDPRVGPRRKISLFALDDAAYDGFPADFYATDAFTDFALEWLDDLDAGRPFFLYLPYTAPHSPLQAPPEVIAKYRGRYLSGWEELRMARHRRQRELGILDARLTNADPQVPAWKDLGPAAADAYDLKMAVFAAQVDRLDQQIGRVLIKLDNLGVADDTLVLFLSDNGADGNPEPATPQPPGPKGSSHIYGRGWANLSNTPFRGYKHDTYEGGIATPLIVRWPREIAPAEVCDTLGHVIDLLPTCLEVAEVEYPASFAGEPIVPVEGRSLVPSFSGAKTIRPEPLFWEHEGNRAAIFGDWKLVARFDRPWELYDLATDRSELHDLAATRREVVAELAAKYDAWAARVGVVPWDDVRRALKK